MEVFMKPFKRGGKLILAVAVLTFAAMSMLPAHSEGQSPAVEPKADELLRKMSAYLAGLEQFSAQTENTLEVVLKSGEKIQFDNPVNFSMRRPNKLRADRKGDIVQQEFYYDGKTLTLYMLNGKYYATVAAPPTIDETIDFARAVLDVYAPAGDLIYANAYDVLMEDTLSGFYVGLSVVGGLRCHHLAFRGNDVDWQIWIEEGDKPLPKKFNITTKWMTGAPQFTMWVKTWNLAPNFTEDIFTFVPPKDSQKIDFVRPTGVGPFNR
jgi:hypothetical protein